MWISPTLIKSLIYKKTNSEFNLSILLICQRIIFKKKNFRFVYLFTHFKKELKLNFFKYVAGFVTGKQKWIFFNEKLNLQ